MLTHYGRLRIYQDGVHFEWDVEKKEFSITGINGGTSFLSRKHIPRLQRMLLSVQHLPNTKLKEK